MMEVEKMPNGDHALNGAGLNGHHSENSSSPVGSPKANGSPAGAGDGLMKKPIAILDDKQKKRVRKLSRSNSKDGVLGVAGTPNFVAPHRKWKNSRRSRNGTGRGLPKKGGAGGKGVWGKLGSELEELDEELDQNDPNFDLDAYNSRRNIELKEVVPEITVEEFTKKVGSILLEYYEHGDTHEVADSLDDIMSAERRALVPKVAVEMAFEHKQSQRELTSVLISDLYGRTITSRDICKGFDTLLANMPDLILDTPEAPHILGNFIARAVADDCIPPKFAFDVEARPDAATLSAPAREALTRASGLLSLHQGWGHLDDVWGVGGALRPVKTLTRQMAILLQEYLLSRDLEEAQRSIKELEVPHFHHELIYEAIVMMLEALSEPTEEAICALFKSLDDTCLVTPEQMEQGFRRVYEDMTDIVLDIPLAYSILDRFVQRCQRADFLNEAVIKDLPSRMDSAENNPNIDPRLLEHLNRHKLTRLVSLLAEAEITSKDLVKFRRNPTLVSGVLPKVRDQLDFTDSLRNVTIDQGAQTDITFFKDLGNTNNVTLTQICELNTNGQKFLRAYIRPNGTKAPITDPMRYHVRNALVEHYYPICEGSITDPWLTQMRDIVMAELPDEDPESWYVAAADGQPASGLLYDRYRTYRKGMRKKAREQQGQNLVNQHSASVKKKRKRPEVQDPAPESQPKPESQWTTLTAEEKNVNTAAKLKLSGMGFSDEAAVKMAWAQSYSLRRHEAVTGVLKLIEWDVLKHFTDTAALVTIDFNTIHGIREDKFHAKLPIFIQRFKRLHEGFLNLIEGDKELLAEAVTSFKSADVNEKAIFLSFYCLPLIIRQGFIKRNDKKTKPSLLDSRNAFITMTETEAKVTEAVTERRKVAAQRKETVQPFIVAVGSLTEIKAVFVTFDELLVKCRSISAAVDLCFKLHSVFHLEYAKECESVMKFIQTYFYEIRYAKDKLESRVRTFISDLNRDS